MPKYLYSIFDVSAGICHQPFVAENRVMAKRSFDSAMEKLPPQMRADEMVLVELGEFHDMVPTVRSLVKSADYDDHRDYQAALDNEIYTIDHYTEDTEKSWLYDNPLKSYHYPNIL